MHAQAPYPYKYLWKTKLKDLEINKVVIGVASLATNTPSIIESIVTYGLYIYKAFMTN
jgi:hypothetical protein